MVALWNRADHYIFMLWFLSSFFPRLISAAAHWMSTIRPHMVWLSANFECMSEMYGMRLAEMQDSKSRQNRHLGTIAQLFRAISSQPRDVSTIGKNLLSSNMSSRCPHNMVKISPLTAEICSVVWDTPANFNGFRVLAALMHGSQVVSVSQTLRR